MTIPNFDILENIWSRSTGGFVTLSTMHRPEAHKRGQWHDYFYMPGSVGAPSCRSLPLPLYAQPHEHDLFFSPLRYIKQERRNDTVGKPGVLFADLDGAPKPILPASVLWETSPGNLQAVWFLTEPVEDYERWAQVNRKLTVYTGADRGGWMGSKVLRVPDSVNWKRREFGKLLFARDTAMDFEYYEESLARIPDAHLTPTDVEYPPFPKPGDRDWLLRLYWDRMSLRGRSMITKERVNDRSLHIVRTIHELLAGGLLPAEVWQLIWLAPWNKWRERPQRLWNEIVSITEGLSAGEGL